MKLASVLLVDQGEAYERTGLVPDTCTREEVLAAMRGFYADAEEDEAWTLEALEVIREDQVSLVPVFEHDGRLWIEVVSDGDFRIDDNRTP